jgi:DNA-binding response OmpR family regulator
MSNAEQSRSILVIGPDPEIANYLAKHAHSGAARLQVTRAETGTMDDIKRVRPDVLVYDLETPGTGGKLLLEQVRGDSATAEVCIIMLVTQETVFLPSGKEKAYPDVLITHPVDREELRRLVMRCLQP